MMKYKIFSVLLCLFILSEASNAQAPIKVILMPLKKVTISTRVEGTVKKFTVKEGEKVKQNQLLVEMDEKYYEQIKNNIDAAFKEAKARKDFAEFEYKQQVQLFQKGVTGKMGVEESKLKAELAIAKYQQVQAKLNLADFDLKSCCIPSPINGRVLKKVAHEFEFVRAGEPVVELIDDTGLLAVMHFPSSTVNDIHEGGKFNIKIAETGKVYKAIITGISAKVDARSQTFEVKARIDNKDGNLRAGMSGQIVK